MSYSNEKFLKYVNYLLNEKIENNKGTINKIIERKESVESDVYSSTALKNKDIRFSKFIKSWINACWNEINDQQTKVNYFLNADKWNEVQNIVNKYTNRMLDHYFKLRDMYDGDENSNIYYVDEDTFYTDKESYYLWIKQYSNRRYIQVICFQDVERESINIKFQRKSLIISIIALAASIISLFIQFANN